MRQYPAAPEPQPRLSDGLETTRGTWQRRDAFPVLSAMTGRDFDVRFRVRTEVDDEVLRRPLLEEVLGSRNVNSRNIHF